MNKAVVPQKNGASDIRKPPEETREKLQEVADVPSSEERQKKAGQRQTFVPPMNDEVVSSVSKV